MRRCPDLLPLFGAVSLPLLAVLADETETILKSSVRIIEGAVAADWELRFLAPERADTILPDNDTVRTRDVLPRPVREAKRSPKPTSTIGTPTAQETRTKAPPPPPPAHDTPNRLSEKTPSPPHSAVTSSSAARADPKVDKTNDADDDNAQKRKKERREILREERKERDYHNRRIE